MAEKGKVQVRGGIDPLAAGKELHEGFKPGAKKSIEDVKDVAKKDQPEKEARFNEAQEAQTEVEAPEVDDANEDVEPTGPVDGEESTPETTYETPEDEGSEDQSKKSTSKKK